MDWIACDQQRNDHPVMPAFPSTETINGFRWITIRPSTADSPGSSNCNGTDLASSATDRYDPAPPLRAKRDGDCLSRRFAMGLKNSLQTFKDEHIHAVAPRLPDHPGWLCAHGALFGEPGSVEKS